MSLSIPLLNSTNVRLAARTAGRRLALRASSALAPRLAEMWAERLFLTPPRSALARSAFFDLIDARSRFLVHRGRRIASWHWGAPDAPAVLLVHGWGGAAAQMRRFVFPLAAAGFRVIAYDQPAHGLSQGRLTGLPDLADALAAVAARFAGENGALHGIIAHSLGATAAARALASGALPAADAAPRIALLSPPSDILGYSQRFARGYGIPERVRNAMQAAIEERYGVSWPELDVTRVAPRLRAPALVIHDRGDRVVPWRQGARFAREWPGARLLLTEGLGHRRLLEDDEVAHAAVDFVAGRSGVASLARPALPDPAPLY
jgi:pimeloyl-ACP methyl ester carboxylesterase